MKTSEMEKKKRRQTYSPRKLQIALESIEKGSTILTASKEFNIPRTTLLYKMNGIRPKELSKPGPKSILGNKTENEICQWIQENAKRGIPLTRDGLIYTVKKLIDEGHAVGSVIHNFNKEKGPGRRWLNCFMKRHPELTWRMSEYLHKRRTFANEASIKKWFQEMTYELKDYTTIFNNPQRVFNCDEISFLLPPKSEPILVQRGSKNIHDSLEQSNEKNVTVLITASGDGKILPPLALFSFKRVPAVIAESTPSHWRIKRTSTGSINCGSFYEYVTNEFYPYLVEKQVPMPVILVIDGLKSHISFQLSNFCKEHQIILMALPPNTSHILQPLELAFLKPLRSQWRKELKLFQLKNNGQEARKHNVAGILEEILKSDQMTKDLQNRFFQCGLCPFEASNIDYSKCIYDEKVVQVKSDENPVDENCSKELQLLEKRLPASILKDFMQSGVSTWSGNPVLSSLHCYWKSLKFGFEFDILLAECINSL